MAEFASARQPPAPASGDRKIGRIAGGGMRQLGWLLVALALWAGAASAQGDPSWARAQRYKAVELFRKQDYEAALPLFQDAQGTYERALGDTSTENIDTLNDVANTLGRLNRAAEAVPVLER